MSVFPSFSLDYIMGLEWETFYYWHRRAIEVKTGKLLTETEQLDDGKVDDDTFEKQTKELYAKIDAYEKSREGIING